MGLEVSERKGGIEAARTGGRGGRRGRGDTGRGELWWTGVREM